MPHSAVSETTEAARQQFADDVEYYLSQTPRQLPSQYLYDALGSALFQAICWLPWYRVTRTELRLLEAHSSDILAHAYPVSVTVELGPGNGEKLVTLLTADRARGMTVHLVDVSLAALEAATQALKDLDQVRVVPHQAPYDVGLAEFSGHPRASGRTLVVFLGSNIGNFDPPGADAFLRNVRASVREGDCLLLGADLVKSEHDLRLAYDDPLGVTAAFNRNLLVRMNRELGADFDVDRFVHRAVWNAEHARVEMHLVSVQRQAVQIPAARVRISFEPGESIWTESSYKYHPDDLFALLKRAGFRPVEQWTEDGFALTLARAD
jgi:L-histidine Nalpha-methyltransferase